MWWIFWEQVWESASLPTAAVMATSRPQCKTLFLILILSSLMSDFPCFYCGYLTMGGLIVVNKNCSISICAHRGRTVKCLLTDSHMAR